MDRNTVIGFVLLGILFIGYLFIQTRYSQADQVRQAQIQDSLRLVEQARVADSLEAVRKAEEQLLLQAADDSIDINSIDEERKAFLLDSIRQAKLLEEQLAAEEVQATELGSLAEASRGTEQDYVIENDALKVTLSNKGGVVDEVVLKQYQDYEGNPLRLVQGENNRFAYTFYYDQDRRVSTDNLFFEALPDNDGMGITFKLDAGEGRVMLQKYRLNDTAYLVDYDLQMTGFDRLIPGNLPMVLLNWDNEMREQERNLDYERQYSKYYWAYANGDIDNRSKSGDEKFDASLKWVSNQQQFFNTTLIARNAFSNQGGVVVQEGEGDSVSLIKRCETELFIPYDQTADYSFGMQWYYAPNHFKSLKSLELGLEDIVPTGTGLSRIINRGIVIPMFNWLGGFISNYGLVILLMTFIIKMALSPLTYRSYLSMAKMRVLQPEINELKEKYKDDQQKQGTEQMKLFRKAGVNPLGGCIPTLLSMPILIALFRFFPGSIELRQKSFLWANDLSTYDDLIKFGFDVPFLGDHLSLFCVLMTLSSILYVQINMSNASGLTKEMRFMQYIFPVFFLFFLNNYPAGLTYYYFVSNMITFGQQFTIRRFLINDEAIHAKIQENKAKPKKKSKFAARLEEAMKQQQEMQKKKKK